MPLDDELLVPLLLPLALVPLPVLLILLLELLLLFCEESEEPWRRGAIGSITGLMCGDVGVIPGEPNRCCG